MKPYHSKIHEFEMISGQLSDKNKILKQWAFFNYLKDIRSHENEIAKLKFSDKPLYLCLSCHRKETCILGARLLPTSLAILHKGVH